MAKKTAIGIDLGTTYSSLAEMGCSPAACERVEISGCFFLDLGLKIGYPGNSKGLSWTFPVKIWPFGGTQNFFRHQEECPLRVFFWKNQAALVCGRTMGWRSLRMTRATEPLQVMLLSRTLSDWSVTPPRIRWHAILRIPPLVWENMAGWSLSTNTRMHMNNMSCSDYEIQLAICSTHMSMMKMRMGIHEYGYKYMSMAMNMRMR